MENQNKQESYSFKTHLVIPANFVITLAVAICFVAVKNFTDDLSPIVIWFYFAISVLATFVAIFDLKVNKEKTDKQKMFVAIMSALNIVAIILYLIFYLIVK